MSRSISVTLTPAQFAALSECIALHAAEDNDYPGDRVRQGVTRARDNAWAKIRDAWHDAARRAPRTEVPVADRCECGHAASRHNELGYCQGRVKVDGAWQGCICDGFDSPAHRARIAAYRELTRRTLDR